MATSTYAGITQEGRTFYVGTLIKRLIPYLPFLKDGQKQTIPKHMGNVVQFRKYAVLSLATTPLTEGTTPAGNSQTVSTVTATAAQYGDFLTVSDVLELAGIDDSVVQATEQLGEQAGQTIHRIIVTELGSGSTVRYASTATTRLTVAAGMNFVVAEVRKAVRDLEKANVPKYPDGTYHGGISPSQKYDIVGDSAFQDLYRYINTTTLQQNEIGAIYGARLYETTDVPIFTGGGAAGIDVHAGVIYGPNAFGVVDLEGMAIGAINENTDRGVAVMVTSMDTPAKSDPLRQRAYVGWKVDFVVKTLDALRIIRVETAVTP
jgi:N4-gp56 family major capsid protein